MTMLEIDDCWNILHWKELSSSHDAFAEKAAPTNCAQCHSKARQISNIWL